MIRALTLLPFITPFLATGQFFDQNFDGTSSYPLPYTIDTAAGTLWQVGPPQKGFFSSAHSDPNVMVTDTLATYPINNNSSFIMKAPTMGFWGWSVFFLRFYHAFDTDTLQEGGYVEISWDNGATWTNIFDDWLMPLNIENYYESTFQPIQADTLPNGQIGYSGRSGGVTSGLEWVYSSFCWEPIGFPLGDSLFVRFSFFSDSTVEFRDGWMIDDVTLESYIAHPVIAYTMMDDYLKVVPNPIEDRLMILYDADEEENHVSLTLHDTQGRLLKVLRDGSRPRGVDHLLLWRNELPEAEGMLVLRADINGRRYDQKLILAPRD